MNQSFFIYGLSVTVASVSQLLLKKSAMKQHGSFLKEYCNPYVITGYGMLFLSMFLTILAFRGMNIRTALSLSHWDMCWSSFLAESFFMKR